VRKLFFSKKHFIPNLILKKGAGTNNWLNTSELLKYFVLPNRTVAESEEQNPPAYFKA